MEQKQHISNVHMDQDLGDSLSFSGFLCVQQQIKSAELLSAIKSNGHGSAKHDTDFKFCTEERVAHLDTSSKHQLIKPVSYNNLSVLLPHCESISCKVISPKRTNGGRKKGFKGGKGHEVSVKKKSTFKSLFEPCRVCHAVEPSAIKEQNPSAGRKPSSL